MSKQVTLLRVFGASPEYLKEERVELNKIICKINKDWDKENIQLKLVEWKTDIPFKESSRSAINEYIEDYDIFIGIIWKKFCISKKSPRSGTLREFDRAISRFMNTPKDIKVMFYFNEIPIRPKDIDIEQLNLINKFKARLKQKAVPYWEYEGIEDFAPLIKMNLTEQIKEWGKTWGNNTNEITAHNKTTNDSKDMTEYNEEFDYEFDEDHGVLDLVEIGQQNFEKLGGVLERITDATENLGERVAKRGSELDQIQSSSPDIRLARSILKRTAEDMDHFVKIVDPEIPILSETFFKGIKALIHASKIINFSQEDENQVLVSLQSIIEMKNEIIASRESMIEFRDAVSNLPQLTRDINVAKRHTVSTLDNLIKELSKARILSYEAEKTLELIYSETE